MDTSEFDTKIGKFEEEIKNHQEQMEKTCYGLLMAASEFIIDWSKKEVDKEVSKSENTLKIGVEDLRKLKSDLNDFTLNVPNLVYNHLNKDIYWGHRGVISANWNSRPLDEGIRIILGHIAKIYQDYGYSMDKEIWQSQKESGQFEYSGRLDFWTGKRSEILRSYREQNDKLLKMLEDLNKVKKEKIQVEAKNLWNQV